MIFGWALQTEGKTSIWVGLGKVNENPVTNSSTRVGGEDATNQIWKGNSYNSVLY